MKNTNKFFYRGIVISIASSTLLGSCTQFETLEFHADKPQSIINQEVLNAYDPLKSYVDYSNQPNFKLGAAVSFQDITGNSLLYRLVQSNFDELNNTTELRHQTFVQADGNMALGAYQQFVDLSAPSNIPVHIGHLVWHNQQQSAYLRSLIADIIIPGESGTHIVADFENNALGDSYPMHNGGSSIVVDDPTGDSGKTLNVKGVQTFPQFVVDLPEGTRLEHCKTVTIDFKGGGCCGLFGQGMRMGISSSLGPVTVANYNSPSGFGIGDNVWGRGRIIMPIANLNLTSNQKELTTFVVTVGSATGAADYLIDNITLQWEIPGETIVKTPEEKKEIITGELEKWIKGVAEIGKEQVKSYSVVYEPMNQENPTEIRTGIGIDPMPANTFYWQDYLGKEYAAIAINMARQYGNTDDNLFITETNLLAYPAKIQGLTDFIAYTEGKGAKVDGIATELALNISVDKSKVESILESLASTGKLIKISALDIGTGGSTAQATPALYQEQADMYKWFVGAYYSIIPANQRAGITFRSPVDRANNSTWRPNEPVGLWTGTGGYSRKPAYRGVAEALQGN